jgi:hypothetical protein
MEYKIVFVVTDNNLNFETMIFIVAPILFVLIGFGVVYYNIWYKKVKSPEQSFKILKSFIFCGIALFIMLTIIPDIMIGRANARKILENKEYKIVEGKIENFHPMPYNGHELESFTVNDVNFEYSDYRYDGGFNNTATHGGPIKHNGQLVRLSYYTVGESNRILKIEIKP